MRPPCTEDRGNRLGMSLLNPLTPRGVQEKGGTDTLEPVSAAILCTGWLDVIQEEAWSFYRTSSGVRLCWELEEHKRPKGPLSSAPPSSIGWTGLALWEASEASVGGTDERGLNRESYLLKKYRSVST